MRWGSWLLNGYFSLVKMFGLFMVFFFGVLVICKCLIDELFGFFDLVVLDCYFLDLDELGSYFD